MNRILPLLSKYVPEDIAAKGLSKIDPKMKKFFSNSVKSGLGVSGAMSFLREKFENPTIEAERSRLKAGVKKGTLRPDENVSAQEMRRDEQNESTLKQLGTAGLALAGGSGALGSLGGLLSSRSSQEPRVPPQVNQLPEQVPTGMEQEMIRSEQVEQQPQGDPFPQLFQVAQKMLALGLSPEEVNEKLSKQVSYRGLVKRFEEKQGSFLDALYELAGGQQGQNQAMPAQGSAGKDQFMQGLAQMSQLLQNLKGR